MLALVFLEAGCYSPCKDLVCSHGQCLSGECICHDGWSGDFCADALNARFEGTYQVLEVADGGNFAYDLQIHPTLGKPNQISIIGLHRIPTLNLIGEVESDGTTLQIPSARLGAGTISSTGTCTATADGKSISLRYQYTSDSTGVAEACFASLSRL